MSGHEPRVWNADPRRVIVTLPGGPAPLPGWKITLHDADTGEQLFTVTSLLMADAGGLISAVATMHADPLGYPLIDGLCQDGDGNVLTGDFSLAVAGIRLAEPAQ